MQLYQPLIAEGTDSSAQEVTTVAPSIVLPDDNNPEEIPADELTGDTAAAGNENLPVLMNLDENSTAVYLNGVSGNDANDGSTKETAVKTFAKAKELATTYQSITSIYITGTVQITGEISLESTNAVLKREASTNGYLLRVASGTETTLKNITVNETQSRRRRQQYACELPGHLNIEDGGTSNNKLPRRPEETLAAVYCNGSSCTMI